MKVYILNGHPNVKRWVYGNGCSAFQGIVPDNTIEDDWTEVIETTEHYNAAKDLEGNAIAYAAYIAAGYSVEEAIAGSGYTP